MTWEPDYCTSAELKSFIRANDTVDDAFMAIAVTTASRTIDAHCHRQFGKVASAEARTYQVYRDHRRYKWVADIDDLQDITNLVVAVDATTITDYALTPRNAAARGRPYLRVEFDNFGCEVTLTGLWGWNAVPSAVKEAALLQSNRIIHRRDSWQGVAGSPELGSELRLLARVDADVAVILSGYRRIGKVF